MALGLAIVELSGSYFDGGALSVGRNDTHSHVHGARKVAVHR